MDLKEKLSLLPESPGCYLMKDDNGVIIYVGKAKVLRNRVKSYFTGTRDLKTVHLVNEIRDFEYIVTDSNVECLILENNLIKRHNPKYNILLKDDKTYPYIKITNEKHPRLLISRGIKKDKAKYFGPYPNSAAAHEVKALLDRLYPLRKCDIMPKKVCLYYHLGQCLAPCVFKVDAEQNKRLVDKVSKFLNGEQKEVAAELTVKMMRASEELNFERAKEYRDLLQNIEMVSQKQNVELMDLADRDVFAYATDKGWMCVQVFFIRHGSLIERKVSVFPYYGEELEDFSSFLTQFYDKHLKPKEVMVPFGVDAEVLSEYLNAKVAAPQRGKKKDLLNMAKRNAEIALQEKFKMIEKKQDQTINALEQLGEAVGVNAPRRIEMFDNSNTQGTNAVSAMAVFIDGKPDKNEYRKYKIKTVQGPDDYASMDEVFRRRYGKMKAENLPRPDLIIVDGGRGHLNVVANVLRELGLGYIPVCGLAKNEKHKTNELLVGDPPVKVDLPRDSQAFYLLHRIQDEVHRFAVTFHRQISGKSMLRSALDDIDGVGEKRRKLLLKYFGSLKAIKEASLDELIASGMPKNIAEKIAFALKEKEPR